MTPDLPPKALRLASYAVDDILGDMVGLTVNADVRDKVVEVVVQSFADEGLILVSAEDFRKATAPTDKDEFVVWAKEMFRDLGLTVVRADDLRTYVADESPDFRDYVTAQVRLRAARFEENEDTDA